MNWKLLTKSFESAIEERYIAEITDDKADKNALFLTKVLDIPYNASHRGYVMSIAENSCLTISIKALEDIIMDDDCFMFLSLICGSCHKAKCNCEKQNLYRRFRLVDESNNVLTDVVIPEMKKGKTLEFLISVNLKDYNQLGTEVPFKIQISLVVDKKNNDFKFIEL